ncbi:DUF488 domain-containing protein [Bariatricus sp. HCP3S3_E12]|uniref:DUF488 domain-containing protein n=1 Tax=Bariatricus sp. HCP3S3_E12 TaxID=3438906 RepID=UPI003F8A30D9
MIRLCNISSMKPNKNCENWMIVRLPDSILPDAKHVPELSPSPSLFQMYRAAYHAGNFDEMFFKKIYVPQFIKELMTNREAGSLLEYLCREGKTKDFYLGCYCTNEKLCHRSIVGGILLGLKAKIETKPEYIEYYYLSEKYI